MMKLGEIILDADISIKVGAIEKFQFLEMIVPLLATKAYIHRYVYEDELLTPKNARIQIDNLIKNGTIEILDENKLEGLNKQIYESTKNILRKYMIGTKEEGKNWGEVVSISIAKALGIQYFVSDERGLQNIVDRHINNGTEFDIKIMRINNIIEWIKETPDCKIPRKFAKILWVCSGKSKEQFDNDVWKNTN